MTRVDRPFLRDVLGIIAVDVALCCLVRRAIRHHRRHRIC